MRVRLSLQDRDDYAHSTPLHEHHRVFPSPDRLDRHLDLILHPEEDEAAIVIVVAIATATATATQK
jgi:hypothetical protein